MKNGIQGVLTAAGIMGVLVFSTGTIAKDDDRTRFECWEPGPYDTSMDARFEVRDGREKFDVSFEAAPKGYYESGDILDVHVNYEKVGYMVLYYQGYDLQGDLEFDTQVEGKYDDSQPFPENFPENVGKGTHISVGYLSCSF